MKGDELGVHSGQVASAEVVFLFGEDDDGAAFGGFVGERCKLRRIREPLGADLGSGEELGCLAIAEGDGAGLVEQQRVDVACRLDRAARHREHVVLHEPVHARDTDRRKQSADGRRNQADQQRDEDEDRLRRMRVDCEGLQSRDRE